MDSVQLHLELPLKFSRKFVTGVGKIMASACAVIFQRTHMWFSGQYELSILIKKW